MQCRFCPADVSPFAQTCWNCHQPIGAKSVSQLVVFDHHYMRLGQYSEPTFLLLELTGSPINNWSGKSEALVGAHHIFPKSTLAWLWEHATGKQQNFVRTYLGLDRNSGTSALARLRSNLISPRRIGGTVKPQDRGDDPHHKYKYRVLPGEESLDLVRTRSGELEPRSAVYRHLAWYVVHVIYPRYQQSPVNFQLRDEDIVHILQCLLCAEQIHYYVEIDPTLPSHSQSNIWELDSEGNYRKANVPSPRLGSMRQLMENYKNRLTQEKIERKRARDLKLKSGLGSSSRQVSRVSTGQQIDRSRPTGDRTIEVNGSYYSLREYSFFFGLGHYSNM